MEEVFCPSCGSINIFVRADQCLCADCGYRFQKETKEDRIMPGGKTEHPMRIFLSYGHPESEICKRIYAALKARGHDVWFDKTELEGRSGLNWRNAIQQGVKESNEVVACLSEHSMRERGVCLDELGIAIGVKGGAGCIHSVLLGKEEKIDPPPTITHDQWLDMRDWQEQLAKGEAEFAPWFQGKMQNLLETLESETNRKFSGEIETIRTRLNVQYATSKQEKLLLQPFVGREWLQEKIDAWLGQAGSEKMGFVSGEPGVGKSAFAAHYAHHNPHAAAILMCEHDMESYNSAKTVIQTLAFLLACRIPEYRQSLLDFLPQEKAELASYSEKELFERLIQNPFSRIVDGNFEPRVIVLDGLDECGDPAQNMLAKTLDEYADRLPHWLHILVIGRATAPMLTYTKNARRIPILADSAENRNDIQVYFIEKLQKSFAKDPGWNAALERMTQRSQGVFLYAELLCDLLLSRGELLPENDYPDGLDAVFARWFGWFFPDLEEYKANWRPAIGCLLGAPEPLPEQTLQEIFAWGENALADFKLRLKVLLREGKNEFDEVTLVISHDYMREWLQRNPGENIYYASPKDGKKKIANTLWAKFADDPEKLSYYEALALLALAEGEQRKKLGTSSDFIWQLFYAGDYCMTWGELEKCREVYKLALQLVKEQNTPEAQRNLSVSYNRVARILETQGKLDAALENYQKSLRIAEKSEKEQNTAQSHRDLPISYNNVGNILEAQGKLDAALENYQKGFAIAEKLSKEKNTPRSRRDLSIGYGKIGNILEVEGKLDAALENYQKSLTIDEELAKEQNTPESRRNLAVSYNNVGGILETKGKLDAALEKYQKGLVIVEKLAEEQNTPQSRLDLSVIYDKVGNILQSQYKLEAALENYQKSLEIAEKLAKEQNTPKSRRKLFISYEKIGNILEVEGKLNAALKKYQKSLEIAEELVNEQNTPESSRDLFVSYNNVGGILEAQGRLDAALENYQKGFAIAEKLANKQNTPESRRDLAVNYDNIGDILKAQGRLDAALERYQKCLTIAEKLANEQNTPESCWYLAGSYNNIGNILEAQGKLDAALENYQKSLAIAEKLTKEQNSPELRRNLSIIYNNVGDILKAQGKLDTALENYQKSLRILRQLKVEFNEVQFDKYLENIEKKIIIVQQGQHKKTRKNKLFSFIQKLFRKNPF